MGKRLIVVHDVLGTLFGFKSVIEEMQGIFGDQVKDPRFAELIVMDWYHAAQRDFCFLSVNGCYQPIANVFKSTLPRVLLQAGLANPNGSSHDDGRTSRQGKSADAGLSHGQRADSAEKETFDAATIDRMMESLQRLDARPGMVQAFTTTYRNEGLLKAARTNRVDLWGATNGGIALAEKLFERAFRSASDATSTPPIFSGTKAWESQASTHAPGEGLSIFSCDEDKVAKPDPRVYQAIKRRIMQGSTGADDDEDDDVSLWFVASHTWDLFAAKQAGFKTAWVTYEEFDMCTDIFGTHDVVASDLDKIARGILEHEQR